MQAKDAEELAIVLKILRKKARVSEEQYAYLKALLGKPLVYEPFLAALELWRCEAEEAEVVELLEGVWRDREVIEANGGRGVGLNKTPQVLWENISEMQSHQEKEFRDIENFKNKIETSEALSVEELEKLLVHPFQASQQIERINASLSTSAAPLHARQEAFIHSFSRQQSLPFDEDTNNLFIQGHQPHNPQLLALAGCLHHPVAPLQVDWKALALLNQQMEEATLPRKARKESEGLAVPGKARKERKESEGPGVPGKARKEREGLAVPRKARGAKGASRPPFEPLQQNQAPRMDVGKYLEELQKQSKEGEVRMKKVEEILGVKEAVHRVDMHGTVVVLSINNPPPSSKIAGFDLDHTLIHPSSGAKFPKNSNDWTFHFKNVETKLKELVASGYKVVIFTNQTAASKNKQLLNELLDKFKKIQSVVGIPMQYVVATKQDQYAKPSTALWELFVGKYNGNSAIDKTNSFFVGDAAGRTKNGKKDFSCSDRKFAYNIGLTFYTETEYFMKVEKEPFSWDGFDADGAVKLEKSKQEIQQELKHLRLAEKQEMIIMCGPPASGKSSFTKLMLVPKGYVAINRDTLGNMEKCLALARSSLESGLSVVIDNTNPKPASREAFIKIAKERGIPVRSFVMQANDLLTHHLNLLRVRMTNGKVSKIPDLVYRVFKKQWVFPAKSEGIDEILSIPFIPNFEDEQHRNLFKEFA